MKYTNVKVPVITMDELTKLQNEYMFFDKILKKAQNKKKKTPGNGFVICCLLYTSPSPRD